MGCPGRCWTNGFMRSAVGALIVLLLAVASDPARVFESVPVAPSPTGQQMHTGPDVTERDHSRRSGSIPAVPQTYFDDPLHFLSTASVDSLMRLPGIGPVLAERMASYRSGKSLFTQWEDLLAVKGIGPKKLERLRRLAYGE